jgi:hypothetical protein
MSCKHDGAGYCQRGYLKRNAGESCRYYEQLRLYLCGGITRDVYYLSKFLKAEKELYEAGFHPVNPTSVIPANSEWQEAMREAISLMVKCDGVALLSDWKESKGAVIEANLALDIGIPAKTIGEWEKPKQN